MSEAPGADTQRPPSKHSNLTQSHFTPEEYKALGTQFGAFLLISTFTVSLIITFLSLAHDIISPSSPHESLMFDIGMLFSFLSTGVHLGIIIVSGRATSLCFRIAAIPISRRDPEADGFRDELLNADFIRYVAYCERLHLTGTMFLLLSILFMAFFMFTHIVFPIVLAGASLFGGATVYRTGFWSVSVMRENLFRLASKVSWTPLKKVHTPETPNTEYTPRPLSGESILTRSEV